MPKRDGILIVAVVLYLIDPRMPREYLFHRFKTEALLTEAREHREFAHVDVARVKVGIRMKQDKTDEHVLVINEVSDSPRICEVFVEVPVMVIATFVHFVRVKLRHLIEHLLEDVKKQLPVA